MPYACIDVGSNTTRLLVAELDDRGLHELTAERVFTRIGSSLGPDGRVPAEKIAEVAAVVAVQARTAIESGAERTVIVGTAAIRRAANRDELIAAIEAAVGVRVNVLSEEDEARLSFRGATSALADPPAGVVAVVDLGGGSTEVAVGDVSSGVSWSQSFEIGSGLLVDRYLHSDPPSAAELVAGRAEVARVFAGLELCDVDQGVAVGGSATSLRRLLGGELVPDSLERAIALLASAPMAEVAQRFDLDPRRVQLLPAGILIFEDLCSRLGAPLRIACGGLREGVILESATENGA